MKKFLLIFIAVLTVASNIVNANEVTDLENNIDEVVLENFSENNVPQVVEIEENNVETSTLRDKLKNVYNLEVDKYDKPNYLLKEVFTHHFPENSLMDRTTFWAGYNGDIGLSFIEGANNSTHVTNHYEFNTINIGYDGFLKDNNADFRIMLNYSPLLSRNVVQNLFADMYIATNKIPHHRILVGNSRPPVGMEGGAGPFTLPFIARSQISRNFGTVRKLGARVSGNYSLVDYDFGVYSSDTYFQEFFPGAEFIGWVNFKPLAKTNGKYGNLKIGAGMQGGHRDNNYCVTGAYIGYEYKRFMANFEWANANGYNGPSGHSVDKHASGFYTTIGYMLTKKLQVLARYDQFNPNHDIANNNRREYSLGFNYFIKGQALRMIVNYVFCQNDNAKDSHRIMLGTQILL